ncbi:MAG TPA: hypothetical protein PLS34_04340 [Gammaproteobacteria bacterium]|nr:hypothetical protein [Gammaproteobacteria bacterium]
MQALNLNLNWTRELTADDGLDALSPLAPVAVAVAVEPARARAARAGLGPATGAMAGVLVAVLAMLAAPMTQPLIFALGGAAGFVYLGTALVSGRLDAALLDLAAAAAAIGIAVTAAGPAVSVLLVHVVWGVLRGALVGAAPGRRFTTCWAAMHAVAALLLGFGA